MGCVDDLASADVYAHMGDLFLLKKAGRCAEEHKVARLEMPGPCDHLLMELVRVGSYAMVAFHYDFPSIIHLL